MIVIGVVSRAEIEYKYLDMDNEVLYSSESDYREALRDRKGKAIERCIPNQKHNQILIAAGIKRNSFDEIFSETSAICLCRKLSGLVNRGIGVVL